MYAINHCEAAYSAAKSQAKGSYQLDVLRGAEALSGGTLKGKAKRFSGKYLRSTAAMMRRLDAAGIPHGERRAAHGKRVLIIGIGCATREEAEGV